MTQLKIIIAGSRSFKDYGMLSEKCDEVIGGIKNVSIVSGCADGADKLGEKYAIENGFELERFPAQWSKYGKSAGPRRNKQMAEVGDILIAFWDGKSRGTLNMIDQARSRNLHVRVYKYTITEEEPQ